MKTPEQSTRVVVIKSDHPDPEALAPAAGVIRSGGLVAFPTETVYGLGANALDAEAVGRIFVAKGRPADNPLIVHVADRDAVLQVVQSVPKVAERLMERFWPGPLTLVLHKAPGIPDNVTCGLDTVGVRMPNHPVALALIKAAGVPVAAPSANVSGRPSPTTAEHVMDDLSGRIDMVLNGGETGVGLESTVIDLTVDPPALLRPGGVTVEQLCEELGPINVDQAIRGVEAGESPRSPGMKYAHYAPKARVIVVDGPVLNMQEKINDLAYELEEEGKRVGVMCSVESRGVYKVPIVLEYGSRDDLAGVASGLFSILRAFDRHNVDVILAEAVPPHGIGLAIMNRLRRAAAGRVVSV